MKNILDKLHDSFTSLLDEEKAETLRMLQGDLSMIGGYGFLHRKLEEQDSRLLHSIFPVIEEECSNAQFKETICTLFRINQERQALADEAKMELVAKHGYDDHHSRASANHCRRLIADLNFDKIKMYYDDLYDALTSYECGGFGDLIDKNNHFLLCLAELLFERTKHNKYTRFPEKNGSELDLYYKNKGLDLNKLDEQYESYGLLSLGDRFELSISNVPKLKDCKVDTHIFLNHARESILELLNMLKRQGCITNLALLPDYSIAGDNIQDYVFTLEELHFGKIFSFNDLAGVPITKLYDVENQNDSLWINIDDSNITFEELLDEWDTDEDSIVTQVVHLQYIEEDGDTFIKHIDHEYIFYTPDEYEVRMKKARQKGSSRMRIKTFKADNSRIPMYLADGSFFLYRVLSEYFRKTDLLKEYFEEVLD